MWKSTQIGPLFRHVFHCANTRLIMKSVIVLNAKFKKGDYQPNTLVDASHQLENKCIIIAL